MKKLLFGICVVLMAAACKNKTTDPIKVAAPKPLALYTLNGIPLTEADEMVNRFLAQKGTYNATNPTSVWFSKKVFDSMYNLIQGKADGIRIYFARDANNNNTIVMVATFPAGASAGYKPGDRPVKVHSDYFQHVLPYLSLAGVRGKTSNLPTVSGASLYLKSFVCPAVDNCDTTTEHYITCDKAYKMVNYYGNDEINVNSEWFDLGIIKDLEDQLAKGGDGIRIYFCRHVDTDGEMTPDTVHRHGFLFIPTVTNDKGVSVDNFICFTLHPIYKKSVDPLRLKGGDDNGELCPVNCDLTTWP